MKKRLIDADAFALELRTIKGCLLGAPGCGEDRARVVEMVEKTLSVAPTIEPESNLWWRDAKVELPQGITRLARAETPGVCKSERYGLALLRRWKPDGGHA